MDPLKEKKHLKKVKLVSKKVFNPTKLGLRTYLQQEALRGQRAEPLTKQLPKDSGGATHRGPCGRVNVDHTLHVWPRGVDGGVQREASLIDT